VDDLAALIAALRTAGIAVETRPDWDGDGSHGRFARILDPDGNPLELWEPPPG
jgi:predicted enzyme related to lactoylglutathione lyase